MKKGVKYLFCTFLSKEQKEQLEEFYYIQSMYEFEYTHYERGFSNGKSYVVLAIQERIFKSINELQDFNFVE